MLALVVPVVHTAAPRLAQWHQSQSRRMLKRLAQVTQPGAPESSAGFFWAGHGGTGMDAIKSAGM